VRFVDPEQIEVPAGESFVVALSGNGVGGYLWETEELPTPLRLLEERDVEPAEVIPGAGGSKEFELVSDAGEATARFALRRSWEQEPGRTVAVRVRAH